MTAIIIIIIVIILLIVVVVFIIFISVVIVVLQGFSLSQGKAVKNCWVVVTRLLLPALLLLCLCYYHIFHNLSILLLLFLLLLLLFLLLLLLFCVCLCEHLHWRLSSFHFFLLAFVEMKTSATVSKGAAFLCSLNIPVFLIFPFSSLFPAFIFASWVSACVENNSKIVRLSRTFSLSSRAVAA